MENSKPTANDVVKNVITNEIIGGAVNAATDHLRKNPKKIWIGNFCITIGAKRK